MKTTFTGCKVLNCKVTRVTIFQLRRLPTAVDTCYTPCYMQLTPPFSCGSDMKHAAYQSINAAPLINALSVLFFSPCGDQLLISRSPERHGVHKERSSERRPGLLTPDRNDAAADDVHLF